MIAEFLRDWVKENPDQFLDCLLEVWDDTFDTMAQEYIDARKHNQHVSLVNEIHKRNPGAIDRFPMRESVPYTGTSGVEELLWRAYKYGALADEESDNA